jgi:hypothetical protein
MSNLKQDDTIWQQLLYYRTITEKMGILCEAQKFQLTTWGEILFSDYAHDIEVHVTLPWVENQDKRNEIHHNERVIEYQMLVGTSDRPIRIKKVSSRIQLLFEGLDRSVKQLLGEFALRIVINGDLIFESGPKAKEIKDVDRVDSAGK